MQHANDNNDTWAELFAAIDTYDAHTRRGDQVLALAGVILLGIALIGLALVG